MNTIDVAYEKFIDSRFPLPTEAQVAEVEQRIGVSLPDGYRRFLLEYNGGFFTEPDIIPPTEDCPEDSLTFLHGIDATVDCAELGSEDDLAIFTENYPAQVLPIGYTLMGNMVLLNCRPEDPERGSVILKKAYSDQYFFLASDIERFFKLVHAPT